MSTKNELPNQGGNVNWEKLERQSKKSDAPRKKKPKKESTPKEVAEEVKKLSDKDRALPYPEEFLAEVNLMRKGIDGGTIDVMRLAGEEDEDLDDEDLDDDDDNDDFDGDDDDFDDDDFDDDDADDDDFDDDDSEEDFDDDDSEDDADDDDLSDKKA